MLRRTGATLLIVAGSALVIVVAYLLRTTPAPVGAPWLLAAALLALAASVLLHRSCPLWALVLALPVALCSAAAMRDAVPVWNVLLAGTVFAAVYVAGRRARGEIPAAVVLAVSLAAGAPAVALATGDPDAATAGIFGLVSVAVLPWLAGRFQWQREEHRGRERRLMAERERANERARIARDLHDSLGHELSLIALRAGALELAADLPAGRRTAAGELRAAVAGATDRLEEVIGVLRTDTGPEPPPAAQEGVAEIVERARAAGAEVGLTRRGRPRIVGPLVDRAVHRVVQEALTNAAKHAPGAPILVSLVFSAEEIEVAVTNEAPVSTAAPQIGGGRGLIGLGERIHLAGGTLRAAPLRQGGFEVVARLPDPAVPRSARAGAQTERAEQ